MSTYRESRNLEASLIDYINEKLEEDSWTNIAASKALAQQNLVVPSISVSVPTKDTQKKEIGSGTYLKFPLVTIRIYANSDGLRMDLADWLEEKLEDNIPYSEYTITNGVATKELTGNIVIYGKLKSDREFINTDPEILAVEDRYRHKLEFSVFIGKL